MHTLRYDTADSIATVAISAEGRILAGTSGSEVLLWNSILDEPSVLPRHPRHGHGMPIGSRFLEDDGTLVVYDNGRLVIFTDRFTVQSAPRPLHWFAAHPSKPLLVVGTGNYAHVWDANTRAAPLMIRMGQNFRGGLAFDETREAVIGCSNGIFEFWSYTDGEPLDVRIVQDREHPLAVSCSPDGRWLAAAFEDRVRIWEIETQLLAREIPVTSQKQFATLAFHPNGQLVTTGSRGLVQQWEPHAWSEVSAHAWRIGATRSMAFSPDGTTAAVGGNLGYVAVWDIV